MMHPCCEPHRASGKAYLASGGALLIGALAPGVAQAQAPPVSPVTVTPQSLAPEHRDSGMRVDIPETGALQAPAGAEGLSVTLGDVEVAGAFPEVAAATEAVARGLRGRHVSLREIYAAASAIEAIHARAGFVLARVSVPPQDLKSGASLRIVVTDGFIESVDVAGLPARVRGAVRARVARLVGHRHVKLAMIEQALLIAGDVPGLRLRSTLMRGDKPGGTRVVLEGGQHLVQGSIGADNQLDPTLGRWETSLQLALNSALGLGEQLYGFVSSGYDARRLFDAHPRERVLGGGVILPLGDGRISINPEATFAVTTPAPAPPPPRTFLKARTPITVGDLRRLTLRASDTLIRGRRSQAGLSLAIEQIEETNTAVGSATTISRDRYMAARPGASWSMTSLGGASYSASLRFSRGLGGLGAISAADAMQSGVPVPFSRAYAGTRFDTLDASAHAAWAMGDGFGFSLAARGQTSFGQAVFRAEQFSLEGADGLSAYVGGRTAVDTGVVVRSEFTGPVVTPGGLTALIAGVSPYGFAAFGAGRLAHPTVVERATIGTFNLGAGLRATLAQRITLGTEYAHGFADIAPLREVHRINSLHRADRVNVSAALRF